MQMICQLFGEGKQRLSMYLTPVSELASEKEEWATSVSTHGQQIKKCHSKQGTMNIQRFHYGSRNQNSIWGMPTGL